MGLIPKTLDFFLKRNLGLEKLEKCLKLLKQRCGDPAWKTEINAR